MLNKCFTSCLAYHTSECRLKTLKMISFAWFCLRSIRFQKQGILSILKVLVNISRLKNHPLAQFQTGDISEGKTVIFGSEVRYYRWQIPPEENTCCYQQGAIKLLPRVRVSAVFVKKIFYRNISIGNGMKREQSSL